MLHWCMLAVCLVFCERHCACFSAVADFHESFSKRKNSTLHLVQMKCCFPLCYHSCIMEQVLIVVSLSSSEQIRSLSAVESLLPSNTSLWLSCDHVFIMLFCYTVIILEQNFLFCILLNFVCGFSIVFCCNFSFVRWFCLFGVWSCYGKLLTKQNDLFCDKGYWDILDWKGILSKVLQQFMFQTGYLAKEKRKC